MFSVLLLFADFSTMIHGALERFAVISCTHHDDDVDIVTNIEDKDWEEENSFYTTSHLLLERS